MYIYIYIQVDITRQLDELKQILYKKFGNSINLDVK